MPLMLDSLANICLPIDHPGFCFCSFFCFQAVRFENVCSYHFKTFSENFKNVMVSNENAGWKLLILINVSNFQFYNGIHVDNFYGSLTLARFVSHCDIAFLTCLGHLGQCDTDRIVSIGQGK
jgi:hypothetical protein